MSVSQEVLLDPPLQITSLPPSPHTCFSSLHLARTFTCVPSVDISSPVCLVCVETDHFVCCAIPEPAPGSRMYSVLGRRGLNDHTLTRTPWGQVPLSAETLGPGSRVTTSVSLASVYGAGGVVWFGENCKIALTRGRGVEGSHMPAFGLKLMCIPFNYTA